MALLTMLRSRQLLGLALLLAAVPPLVAQSVPGPTAPTTPTAPYSAHEALAAAFQHLDDAEKDVHRFTYFLDLAMGGVTPSGRMRDATTLRYEATYIHDLLYMHLLEQNGTPLAGSALKDEQKRYDKALAKKKSLNDEKRADTDGYSIVKPDLEVENVLDSSYTLAAVGAGVLDGESLHEIEATPIPGAKRKSSCAWRVHFLISDKTGNLRRYIADTTGDTRPQCVKEVDDEKFVEVDGIPKLSVKISRFNLPEGDGSFYASKSQATYSNYRRFGASVTFKTGNIVPPDEPAKGPAKP